MRGGLGPSESRRRDRTIVEAVRPVDTGPQVFHRTADRLVLLEHPGEFTGIDTLLLAGPEDSKVHQGVDPQVAVLGNDAKCEYPDPADLLRFEEDPDQAEGKQPPVRLL